MKVKTSELKVNALDYAVALAENYKISIWVLDETSTQIIVDYKDHFGFFAFSPSTNWSQGGPIIDREKIELFVNHSPLVWSGFITKYPKGLSHYTIQQSGSAPLIAAMRCFVASKLGEEVEIPEELIK